MANWDVILKDANEKMLKAIDMVKREFLTVRTGRASTGMLDTIKVEYYGTLTPLKQLAAIGTPDPRLLTIQPFDPSSIAGIEKAILQAELGLVPTHDGKTIRISVPELTQERRQELEKLLKRVSEEGRVSIRAVRRDANEHAKKMLKDKQITEDDEKLVLEQIQKLTDNHIKEIDVLLKKKEDEIHKI